MGTLMEMASCDSVDARVLACECRPCMSRDIASASYDVHRAHIVSFFFKFFFFLYQLAWPD